MDAVLPPSNKGKAELASGFGPRNRPNPKASAYHEGVDFSYPALDPPGVYTIFSPVAGVVTRAGGGSENTLIIKDDRGYYHRFLHNDSVLVKLNQRVSTGTPIAKMGQFFKGSKGGFYKDSGGRVKQLATHVHYEVWAGVPRVNKNDRIDPVAFWGNQKQTFLNIPKQEDGTPVPGALESDSIQLYDIAAGTIPWHNQRQEGTGSTIADYRPRMAAVAPPSDATTALLPNRVPLREPWPRVMLVNTEHINAPTDEVDYNTRQFMQYDPESPEGSKQIGRVFGEEEITRSPFWRR